MEQFLLLTQQTKEEWKKQKKHYLTALSIPTLPENRF
jgi:hypothetical protein